MFGFWDLILIAIVSVQITVLAYVKSPRWKALIFGLPIPLTFSSLALGKPIAASNVLGLWLVFLYAQGVRLLHRSLRVPIVPAIVVCALGYAGLASLLAPITPASEAAFWLAAGATWVSGILLLHLLPPREEPGQRSGLPVYIKLPIVAGIIVCLLALKNTLQGFMTVFPMVGTVAAYESRQSLWTFGRQVPVIMITITPLMMVGRLLQPHIGLGPALAVGWLVFLGALLLTTRLTGKMDTRRARTASVLATSTNKV